MRYPIVILLFVAVLFSCDYFKQDAQRVPLARVNDSYLYQDDIADLISESTSETDSALIVSSYINRWATQQLLIDKALINLPESQIEDYNKLVEEYKNDLYTEAYKSMVVGRQLDSAISEFQLRSFYESNKENFRLNETLLKVRYIHLDESFSNLSSTKEMFERYNETDQEDLTELSLKFKAFNLNDSIWVKEETLLDALPVLASRSEQVLKKSNFTQLQDSLGLYLVKIEDVLSPNDMAPLIYVKPTIEQVILNKRKLELIQELEIDITKDAIKNNSFEIYTRQ